MGSTVERSILETLPGVRIVQILRDPVDRLWSAYTFQRSLGHLPPGMEDFDTYVQACRDARREHARVVDQGAFKGLAIGMYGDQLPGWEAAFGDDLRSIVLYGSAAEGRLRATSDINVMFVLGRFDEERANQFREPFRFACAAAHAPPRFSCTFLAGLKALQFEHQRKSHREANDEQQRRRSTRP